MKYLFLLLCFSFSFAQNSDDKMYSITYLNQFKDRKSIDFPLKEYSRLLVNKNESIYQIYNAMHLDTLKFEGTVTSDDRNRYYSFNKHSIYFKNNTLKYNDVIYEDEYYYEETINHSWELKDEEMDIKGYSCRKAITNYGGREWEAWYTLDLPINAGPYKFKGLPGLILKLTDSTGSYNFDFYAITERELKPLKKYHHLKPKSEWINTTRTNFNKIKANYESLSLNEKLNYGNTGPKIKVKLIGGSDDSELRNPKKVARAKDLNLIEIDYKD
ncbi:GLPGLI family protein [uncultured Winogradskyella sp.]|uniref:GLPGLI family protein n=1 Tax=uncultured Winogradskyella sp. TaxID=395353 RepID=UPI0026063844|nr:GLPGLI family protein [uncultured Winogradskyella sp.]